MTTWNTNYLDNEIKYGAEICQLEEQLEVIYDGDYDYCIEICINWKNGRIWWRYHGEDNEHIKLPVSW